MMVNCEENSKAATGRKRNNMILDCGEQVNAEQRFIARQNCKPTEFKNMWSVTNTSSESTSDNSVGFSSVRVT